jgi:hypothetical protein
VATPAVRARHLKSILEAVSAHPDAPALRAALPSEIVDAVAESKGGDWLPLELDVALVRVLHATLGPDRFAELNRKILADALQGPLLASLAQAAMTIFGDDPGSWVRWVPRAWAILLRGCGTWRVKTDPEQSRATLSLTGLPPLCAEDPVWLASVASTLSAIPPLLGRPGTVTLEQARPHLGGAIYCMRWGPRAGATARQAHGASAAP